MSLLTNDVNRGSIDVNSYSVLEAFCLILPVSPARLNMCQEYTKGHSMTMRSLLSHIGAQWGEAKIKKQSEI